MRKRPARISPPARPPSGSSIEDVQDYRQAIALYQAWGYEQELGSCRQFGATATGSQVRCPFAYHLLGSRELGVGPFDGSYFTVTVDDASGMITEVSHHVDRRRFRARGRGPVHRLGDDDASGCEAELMSVDGGPALTPESLALWEQSGSEYVQYVLGNYTDDDGCLKAARWRLHAAGRRASVKSWLAPLRRRHPGDRRVPLQAVTLRAMSTPVSALLTGHPTFALSAAASNPALSRPSTSPPTVSVMPVNLKPPAGSGPRLTSAITSSVLGVPPATSTSLDSDIA